MMPTLEMQWREILWLHLGKSSHELTLDKYWIRFYSFRFTINMFGMRSPEALHMERLLQLELKRGSKT